jgi:hypothetical protein
MNPCRTSTATQRDADVPVAAGLIFFCRQWRSLRRTGAPLTAGAEMKWRNGWSVAGTFEGSYRGPSRTDHALICYVWVA